ncbi:type II toxin-antitoxin system RelE/ParE family toxin [Acidobacteriota bacterium]
MALLLTSSKIFYLTPFLVPVRSVFFGKFPLDTLLDRAYNNMMNREFISLDIFSRLWEGLGLNDDDLKELQEHLSIYPETGEIIKKTGGVRKMRWALKSKGKRGGIRVLYIDFISYEKIYLLMVYPKSKKENITDNEKKVIRKLVEELKNELRRKKDE